VTLGDVAGKSVPAAILMAKLSSDVRSCLLTEREPAAALSRLNSLLYRNLRQTDRLITFAAAFLDAAKYTVTMVNAGHCPPLLYRRSSGFVADVMPVQVAGVPLGVDESPTYGSSTIELEVGDSILFFTDGITDALSPTRQRFNLEGIRSTLRGIDAASPRALVERLVKAVEKHAAGHPQYDDITLVCIGRVAV
jgi:serine phosphatase RsbU (regulator of sigma subunit)